MSANARFGSQGNVSRCNRDVRFTPESGHRDIHTARFYGFLANTQKPVLASSTNRAFTNPVPTSE